MVWGLVIALAVTYGFGLNRHIHVPAGETETISHAHQAEVHLSNEAGLIDAAPNGHDDTGWILLDIDGPGITKKAPGSDVMLALFGVLLLLCLLRQTDGLRLPLVRVIYRKRKILHSILPPSHAPPR